ncbi:MAG: hypothetical protein OXC11_16495, partial [Rhodospirillales bacterium]|nr:hypothetical protein [Rhodospirillales bacterium]
AGDVIMTIMFREKQWVRVGNIITGRGDATARAAIEALMLRVAANEQLASDIDRIVDGVSWANAPAAEAQFAAILATSALGRKITRVDTTAIDPGADIPAATAWNTVLNPVPDDSAILIRVKTGLASIQFRMNNNGSVQPLFSFRSRVSDADWDYYDGGIVSGGASAIEKRAEAFHTAFHGELSGRALEQVGALSNRRRTIRTVDATTDIVEADRGNIVAITDDLTSDAKRFDLPAIADVGAGFEVTLVNAGEGRARQFLTSDDADRITDFDGSPGNTLDIRPKDAWTLIATDMLASDNPGETKKVWCIVAAAEDATDVRTGLATQTARIDTALRRTQRLRPVSQWVRGLGAQTILLEWKPVGAVANGAALAVNVGGTPITGVTAPEGLAAADTNGTVLALAVNAVNAGNIDRAASTAAGHVEIQITHGGIVDTTWMGVNGGPKWRELAGSSPYTVKASDDEFAVALIRGAAGVDGRVLVGPIPRVALTQAAKFFAGAEANPFANATKDAIGANLHLNAAGTSLTAVKAGVTPPSGGLAKWAVEAVYAR